ncbi:MAG: NAD-dependent epimerase/dehydratase family protein [Nitrososphaerales archaeon]
MKAFITGHTGFIGSNLVSHLESMGSEVHGCSRRTGCDVNDREVLAKRVASSDIVYHLAAEAKPAESVLTPWDTFETNTRMTTNVALACRDANIPMVFVSSCEIYGDCKTPISEGTQIAPTNPYSASKAACDRLLYSFYRAYGLDVKIVRLFNPYGPHQQLNKIIPTFFRQAKKNLGLTVYGDGNDTRDYVFVDDIVQGLWAARELPAGEAVNLATGIKTRTIDMANTIMEKVRSESRIAFVPYPKIFGGIRFQVGSFEKAKKLLEWEPATSLDKGLDLTISWLESIGDT